MRILELFSGTKSIGKVFEKNGFEVISLDNESKWNPSILTDILDWDYQSAYPPNYFDVIWASPPCTCFSSARWFNNGRFGFTTESLNNDIINIGLPPLIQTLKIIKYFQPKIWYIENPQTGRMKNFLDLPYSDCAYCSYGMLYRKKTRIWNNINLKLEKCKCKTKHQSIIVPFKNQKSSGGKFKTYIIPEKLCESIYNQTMEHLERNSNN